MQYVLLIHEDENVYADSGGQAWRAILDAHTRYGQDLAEAGVMRSGAGLKPTNTATTVRTSGTSQTVHDGPFAETREQLGGFYVIDVPDLDAAIAWARRLPLAGDGSVEIRPGLGEM